MAASLALFSGFNKSAIVPSGNLAKASSVGAKTVKGPSLFNVVTKSAAPRAAAKVLKDPAATAVSTMSFGTVTGTAVDMYLEVNARLNACGADVANLEADPATEALVRTMVIACIIVALSKRFEL
jgi:hypothetical protein